MSKKHGHEGGPMPYTEAAHLLNPLRRLFMSPRKLVRRLNLRPEFTVLELGPGPGYFSVEIARSLTSGKLILVDLQQEMLDMARERLESAGAANVDYRKGDANSLPVEDASCDVVFLVAVLGEVPDRVVCLREIRRVLRLGGILSITEQLGDPDRISLSEVMALAESQGFKMRGRSGFRFNFTANFNALE